MQRTVEKFETETIDFSFEWTIAITLKTGFWLMAVQFLF